MTADRRRVAIHEAGHALGLWLFFPGSLSVVSIRPGRSHVGITLATKAADGHLSMLIDGRHPLDGLDPEARRYADRVMTMVLLGGAAEDVLVPQIGRQAARIVDGPLLPTGNSADHAPMPLAKLAPAVGSRLAEAEADPDGMADEARAFEQAYRLVGMAAVPYLAWLTFEAQRIATEHAAGISAVAGELLAREIVDDAPVAGLFSAHERST